MNADLSAKKRIAVNLVYGILETGHIGHEGSAVDQGPLKTLENSPVDR